MTGDRIEANLRGAALAGLSVLAAVCIVVFAVHKSADSEVLRWSWWYVLGAMSPVLAIVAAQAVLVVLPPLPGRRDRYVALGCLVSAVLLLVPGVLFLPLYELPVMAVFLGLMALPLAGYRAFRRDAWLTSFIALLVPCLALFIPEAVRLALEGRAPGDHRLPVWGDHVTFRHLFPEAEPFTSEGGRLQPNLDVQVFSQALGERSYRMRTNSQGFRNDHEIPPAKEPGELRILSLGDSFSVGYGIDQERFLGPILESRWREQYPGRKITVINAEVSDPAYGLLYLQRFGIGYSPDIVLYGYVDNDSHQAYLPFAAKGIFTLDANGEVRTHSISLAESVRRSGEAQGEFSGYVYPRSSPARLRLDAIPGAEVWVSRLRASLAEFSVTAPVVGWLARSGEGGDRDGQLTFISTWHQSTDGEGHLRLIDFASQWGMLYKQGDAMTAPFYANLSRVFASMQKTAASHGAALVLAYFPRREQVQPQDWARFQEFWNLDPDDFDLDLEATRLRSLCAELDIPFIDTSAALRTAARERGVYLNHDLHFNEDGQAVAAAEIARAMEKMQIGPSHGHGSRASRVEP